MRGYLPLLAPLVLAASSCGDANLAPAQRLWTMADLQLSSGQNPCTNPADLPCHYFVDKGVDGNDVLQFKLAFSEGQPMGYMTTDFWANYDRIWLEPMYILVTAWNNDPPAKNRLTLEDGKTVTGPIFSVGPKSAFYSPYWQVFYVEVPAGTPPTRYTAARQLFDDHLTMHAGPNRFASIGPDSVSLPSAADISNQFPDIGDYLKAGPGDLEMVVASSKRLSGWLDGAAVSYVDFGTDNFEVDAAQVIQDVPLFVFYKAIDPLGKPVLGYAPNVGGVAPLFSGISGRVSAGNRPQFGALWRLHLVQLPATAQIFLKDDETALVNAGADAAVFAPKVTRVALDGRCFATVASAASCVWLDSQAALENNLGAKAIQRTALQPACPFVMFNGLRVPYQ